MIRPKPILKNFLLQVKIPFEVSANLFKSKKGFYLLKLVTVEGIAKKKFNFEGIDIFLKKNILFLDLVPLYKLKKGSIVMKFKNKLKIFQIIINKLIHDLFKPKKSRLILEGIGFKVWKKKNFLKFKLGYSHFIFITIPKGIKISLFKQKKIVISGLSSQKIGEFKTQLRLLRYPDAYKGKGVRIWGDILKLKVGKKSR